MARRSRRGDEVTPKLHYRPGVDDPDLEAAIVGFYGARQEVPAPCPGALQPIDRKGINRPTDTIADGLKETVSADSRYTVAAESTDTVSTVPEDTVGPGQPDTVADEPAATISVEPSDTVAVEPTETVAVELTDTVSVEPAATVSVASQDTVAAGLPRSKQGAGDRAEERGSRTYERIAKKHPTDTVSAEPSATVARSEERRVGKECRS